MRNSAAVANNNATEDVKEWKEKLATVFNSGFWDVYYLGRKMGEWCDENGSKSSKKKIYLAKGLKYFEQAKVGEFQCESHSLSVGDEIMITGPTTGYIEIKIEELRLDGKPINKVLKGDIFTIFCNEKIRPSDKLYKLVSEN